MRRRHFLATATAVAIPLNAKPQYRVGVIGHTGRGNYGHGVGDVWSAFPQTQVVAVADPDPQGRADAKTRTGAEHAYADFRKMLAKQDLDIVSICPRHLDQRLEMTVAAADAGCHMYHEKSFAATLTDADQMVVAIRKASVKVQLAHQMRRSPFTLKSLELINNGEIGQIQEVRTRGKEDFRAGGEDLVVLGSHVFDMMRIFLGDPSWVFAHITTKGSELEFDHLGTPNEPIGPIAGRQMAAMFSFTNGVHGYFNSKLTDTTHAWRFGTHVYGSKGRIFLPNSIYDKKSVGYILRSPAWVPDKQHSWQPIEPEHRSFGEQRYLTANALMVEDLLEAIEQDREPACSERAGRWTVEMTQGMYASQLQRSVVDFPLKDRRHPLEELRNSKA